MSKEEKLYNICAVRFQREEGGEWEPGIGLNEGELMIIDQKGKTVEKLWDYRKHMSMFSVDVSCYMERLQTVIGRKPKPFLHEG